MPPVIRSIPTTPEANRSVAESASASPRAETPPAGTPSGSGRRGENFNISARVVRSGQVEVYERQSSDPLYRPLRVFASLDDAIAARRAVNDLSEAAARAIVARGVREVEGGVVWSSDPRLTLVSPQRYTEDEVLAMLAGIRAPTRLVLADPPTSYLPSAMMDSRASRVADIRVAQELLGYAPKVRIRDGLSRTIDAMKKA